ncbi:DNA topoisomerase IB [Rudanella paleaurantiibacter]|uniref:DNA topoisomerase n=1 Tax=Rudanella paleaurantiibacter TaxID=2614655 RepID=A0A7J5TWE6_9BACT|nr:DNA topoisomerase IB [Rudanella paleaurantiibacter]KAB7728770.1 DNA topoisomerase IB [Rudanella paleaurantiibacter]
MNLLELAEDPVKAAKAAKLQYTSDTMPGISRQRQGDRFTYLAPDGQPIDDDATLTRISNMALPPAWEKVWICAKPNGHLQATGIDTKNRKQYRYHANWNAIRSETKFFRMISFGQKLPLLRQQIEQDLKKTGLPRDKVIAIALSVMEHTLIRIGNAAYEKEYGSYGLTTLKDRHVKMQGAQLRFSFKGKKGIYHDITLHDRRLSRLVKACRDIPGKELFQYFDETGERRSIDSGMVNEYLQDVMGDSFSAKDFRTWAGTVNALRLLVELEPCTTEKEAKKNVNTVLDEVSHRLGNTRTVCRKHYVHPQILEAYECQDLNPYIEHRNRFRQTSPYGLDGVEKLLLKFLTDQAKTVVKQTNTRSAAPTTRARPNTVSP